MELHPAPDRESFGDDLEILRLEALAERSCKDLARLAADQRMAVGEPAATSERIVDRDIARLVILDEEDDVADTVEELDARERASEHRGERRGRIVFGRCARDFADSQPSACVFIKNGSPGRANVWPANAQL